MMTSSKILNVSAANTDDLPRPDVTSSDFSSAAVGASGQNGAAPDTADMGRISFGAALRMPLSK